MRLRESLERLGLGLKSSRPGALGLSAIVARGSYFTVEIQNAAFA